MLEIFDVYMLEAIISGILLGGVLALLALGLNLIFGVIDVVWICYAELIMIGMYALYYFYSVYGVPMWLAVPACILLVAGLGLLLHYLVIEPLLDAAPINQLLATGGVLFFLQSFATVAFGIDFRNLGIRLPVLGDRRDALQLRAAAGLPGGAGRHGRGLSVHDPHLHRHRDPRDLAGSPDHGPDGRRHPQALPRDLGAGRRAWPGWPPACWCCSTTSIPSSACRSGRSPS